MKFIFVNLSFCFRNPSNFSPVISTMDSDDDIDDALAILDGLDARLDQGKEEMDNEVMSERIVKALEFKFSETYPDCACWCSNTVVILGPWGDSIDNLTEYGKERLSQMGVVLPPVSIDDDSISFVFTPKK